MANKQYLIELAVKDDKLNSSLKKALMSSDVQKTLGILGEGITEHLEKDVGKAASILGKVDWASLLGEKDFERLQQLTAKTISANKDLIKSFIKSSDTQGIQNTIKFVSELNAELKAIDPEFTTKGLARSMASFMKTIEPMLDAPDKISTSFGGIANSIDKSMSSAFNRAGKTLENVQKDILNKVRKGFNEQGISEMKFQIPSDELDEYVNGFKDAKSVADELNKVIERTQKRMRDYSSTSARSSQALDFFKEEQRIIALREKLIRLQPSVKGDSITKDLDVTVEQVVDKLEKSFNKIIEDKLSSIKVKVDVPTEEKLITDLNTVIEKVNAKGTNSLKLVGAESAINEAQKKMLASTQEWHNRMKDALKFSKKDDIELDLGVKMREIGSNVGADLHRSIEEYFNNPANKVAVPVELVLSGEHKAIIEGGGNITVNGGVGGGEITAESLAKALTTPIEVKVQEEQSKDKPSGKLISIDHNSGFAQEVIDVFDELFKAIERGGENAKKISEFFTLKGIDLSKLKSMPDDTKSLEILQAYESLLEKGDRSILDSVDNRLIKGSTKNKATIAFRDLLHDSVFRFGLENIAEKEDVKRRQVRTLVEEDYIPRSVTQESIYKIRDIDAKDYKLPTVEELDKLMADLPETWGKLGEDFVPALDILKQLRATITDPTNETEINRFKSAAKNFATETELSYREMGDFMHGYKIGVFNKGHNKHNSYYDYTVNGGVFSGSKLQNNLDKVDYFELYDDPSGHFSRGNRQDAMDNASRFDRYQLRRDARIASYRSKEPTKTSLLAEDVEIPKFEPKEKVEQEAQEVNGYREAAQKRIKAINDARKTSEEEAKAAEELRKQELETDKKRRTALKRQRTKNENKLKGVTSEDEALVLKAKNEQLSQEIAELDANISKNSVEPTKAPTVLQQLKDLPKESEIQKMHDEVDMLDQKIEDAKKESQELEKLVTESFKAEEYDIEYKKSEKNNQTKSKSQNSRLDALSKYLTDKTKTDWEDSQALTDKDESVVSRLLSDRKIYQMINGEGGLALPQNSQLENIARQRIQVYSEGLNKIDEFILKNNISVGTAGKNSELTEFMKDKNVTSVLTGTFKGSQEDESAIRTSIDEFKTRMIEAGKSYVADYIDMWSNKNLREMMGRSDVQTRTATDAKTNSILQEFYRILTSGGVGDFSKREEAYQYLQRESAKYQKNIQKSESSLGKIAVSVWEQTEVTDTKNQAATERVKDRYKEYVNQWLYTIQENMYNVLFGELDNKDAALALKKNEELRGLIGSLSREYLKEFDESLLTEDQSNLLERTKLGYNDFLKGDIKTLTTERDEKQSNIDSVIQQKAELLRQRRFDLLNKISDGTEKGKDTASLEKALLDVENELIKYSDQLPHLVREEFEADLLNAKNATEEEWRQFQDNATRRRNEFDKAKYTELKGQQKSILGEIAQRTKDGKSTSDLEQQLKTINKEIVQYEVNASRLKDVELAKFPNDSSISTISIYNHEMAELVKLQQERMLLEAKDGDTGAVDLNIAQQKKQLKNRVKSGIKEDQRIAAEYAPGNQAAKFIEATDKLLYELTQLMNEEERELRQANDKLARIQGDKYYNDSLYTGRIESLKDRDVEAYIHSDEYRSARDSGVKRANEEFGAYLTEQLGEDVAKRIVYEFANNEDRANIDEMMKGAGNTSRLVEGAFGSAYVKEYMAYTNSEAYQKEVAEAKKNREEEIDARLASDRQIKDAKIQEIWDNTKADIAILRNADMANSKELREAVYAEAEKAGMGDSSEYRRAIVDDVRESLIQQRIDSGRQEQKRVNQEYYEKAKELRSQLSPDMYKKLDEQADQAAYNAVMTKIQSLVGDNKDVLSGLDAKRSELIEAYVKGIVQEYRDGLAITETGMYMPRGADKPINVREMLAKEYSNAVAYHEQKYIDASGKRGMLENERARAQSFGELGYDEILNPDVARVRAETEARLSAEKEKQVALTERLTDLTAQNADQKIVQSVAAELRATEKTIERLQVVAEGAAEALSVRKIQREEELEEKRITPERQKLWFIDHIEEAKKVLESGTDKEKERATNNIARWEQKLANVEKIIESNKPEAEKPRTVLDMIAHAIRDGLAGVTAGGNVDLDASMYNIATETTLQEILRLLGGNGAVEYANQLKAVLEKDRPHYERRKYEGGNTGGGSTGGKKTRVNKDFNKLNSDGQRIYGELEAEAKLFTNSLKKGGKQYAPDFNFVKAIKEQAAVVKKQTKGSLEYIQEQTKLTALYQDYYNKTFGKGRRKKGQPGQSAWAEKGELGKITGLKDLLLFKSNRADALVGLNYGVDSATQIEEAITENKSKKSNKKSKKSNKKKSDTSTTTVATDNIESDSNSQAVEDKLSEMLKQASAGGMKISDEMIQYIKSEIAKQMNDDGLGRDEDVKTEIKEGVKEGVVESSKTTSDDKKLPYEVDPNSLIGKLQNTVGGNTGELAKQATLALVLSELQAISNKIPTIGKSGVKSSAQNLLEEFQKMAMGSAMDSKERVANFDLVNGVMSPALSGTPASISQKLLDTLSQDFGVDKGYRSQVHTHADSDQTWFSGKDLDHFKKNIGDFGADSIKQQILLTKDNITVFDMTMVETAENAKKAIEILKNAGSNVDNEALEKLAELGARYQSKSLDIGAKGLMDLLGVKNYKNDSKKKGSVVNPEVAQKGLEDYAKADADKRNSKYVFNSFDGETLKYQLVDMGGHISKVILAWDELENKVRVVSDTSTSSMDATVQKIQQYRDEIKKAQSEKLLSDGDDAGFVAASQKVDEILAEIEAKDLSGEALNQALNQLEEARTKLADEGQKLHKLIAKNNKLRSGTAEVKSAVTQGVKVRSQIGDSIEVDEQDGVQLFDVSDDAPKYLQDYVLAYNELVKVQQQYINDGQINNPKIQDALKVQAASVKKLGLEAMRAYQNTLRLQEKSDIWEQQTYTDKAGNEHSLGGSKYVGGQGVDRATMLQYAKEVLGADLASVKLNTTTGKLTGVLRKNNYVVADMAVEYDKTTGKMHLFQEKERESLGGLPGFINALKAKSKAITQYMMSMTSIYRVIGELRKGIQYVREIDSALTELKKVTDETEETYDRFLDTAAKTADKVGSTIKEIVSSTADWSRLGYSMKEAARLAESTAVLLNVSEFQSIDDATKALTSTMQAFGYTAKDSMHVVDVMNEIGNNYAISSDGIATALQDSASSLMAANNSYQEAVALIAAANRVVQDPNSVGAALRTISLRLRGTSTEQLEEAGEETDGAITSKSKLRSKIQGYTGIDILTDSGAYKSTYEILLEISKVWDDLTDMDRAGLLEMIAGKTRSNTAAAILANTKDLEAAYKSAMEAEGSAYEENEKYLESIQGRIDLFNNAVQTMWNNTLNNELVKGVVDLGTGLIKIVDKLGLINTLLIGFGLFATKKYNLLGGLFGNKKDIESIQKQYDNLKKKADEATETFNNNPNAKNRKKKDDAVKNRDDFYDINLAPQEELLNRQTAANKKLEDAKRRLANAQAKEGTSNAVSAATMKQYEGAVRRAEKEVSELNEEVKEKIFVDKVDQATTKDKTATTLKELAIQIMRGEIAKKDIALTLKKILVDKLANTALGARMAKTLGVTTAELASIPVTKLLTVGFTELAGAIWTALTPFLPFIAAAAAVVGVIALVVKGIDEVWTTAKEAKENLENLNSEIDSLTSDLDSLNSELETTQERMEDLLSKDTLSFTEQEELNNLKLQNEQLERQIELQELILKNKKEARLSATQDVIEETWNTASYGKEDYQVDIGNGVIKHDNFWSNGMSGKKALKEGIENYTNTKQKKDKWYDSYLRALKGQYVLSDLLYVEKDTSLSEKYKEKYEKTQTKLQEQANGINMVLGEMSDIIAENELQYGQSDEIDKFLDEYYAMTLKWQEAQGVAGKSDIIKGIFSSTASEGIQQLKEDLDEITASDLDNATKQTRAQELIQNALKSTDKDYQRLKTTMDTLDLTAEELAESFIAVSEAPDIDTLEGVLEVFAIGEKILKQSGKYSKSEMSDEEKRNRDNYVKQNAFGSFKGKVNKFDNLIVEPEAEFEFEHKFEPTIKPIEIDPKQEVEVDSKFEREFEPIIKPLKIEPEKEIETALDKEFEFERKFEPKIEPIEVEANIEVESKFEPLFEPKIKSLPESLKKGITSNLSFDNEQMQRPEYADRIQDQAESYYDLIGEEIGGTLEDNKTGCLDYARARAQDILYSMYGDIDAFTSTYLHTHSDYQYGAKTLGYHLYADWGKSLGLDGGIPLVQQKRGDKINKNYLKPGSLGVWSESDDTRALTDPGKELYGSNFNGHAFVIEGVDYSKDAENPMIYYSDDLNNAIQSMLLSEFENMGTVSHIVTPEMALQNKLNNLFGINLPVEWMREEYKDIESSPDYQPNIEPEEPAFIERAIDLAGRKITSGKVDDTTHKIRHINKYAFGMKEEDREKNRDETYNFFKDKGLSDKVIAAITGNLEWESNYDTDLFDSVGDVYGGIAQWRGERLYGLIDQYGEDPTLNDELNYLWSELTQGDYTNVLPQMTDDKSLDELTELFSNSFEQPNANLAFIEERQKKAKKLFDLYTKEAAVVKDDDGNIFEGVSDLFVTKAYAAELTDEEKAAMQDNIRNQAEEAETVVNSELANWYDSLDEEQKSIVYELSLQTDTTEWDLADWKEKVSEEMANQTQLGVDESGKAITWGNLFKEVDGKKVADNLKVAEILKGADKDIRDTFIKLIEEVENGKMSVDEAMAKWEMAGIDKMTDVLNAEFESVNNELFPDAADEISGLIDTLGELKAAFESVASTMDKFKSAQEEMNATGRVSIQTALELMSSTDDWDSILNITEDTITLVAGSEEELMGIQLKQIEEQTKKAAELAAYKLKVAKEAKVAAEAFEAETQATNDLNGAEQDVMNTQDAANVITNTRTQQLGNQETQVDNTAGAEIDYANNDKAVVSAEGAKAKAIGLVSAMIIGLDSAIQAFNDASFGSRWKSAAQAFYGSYTEAKKEVLGGYDIEALQRQADQTADLHRVAKQADTYDKFSKNYNSDKDGGGDDDRLANLQKKYEGKISNLENQKTWLENEISREEEIGLGVSKAYYEEQIKLNDKLSEQYEKQRADLIELRKVYPEGSEKWYEVSEAIWEIDHALQELTTDSIKASKSIIDLYTDAFAKLGEAFGDKSNISEKIISSMESYAELLDLRGGTATKGLYDAIDAEYDKQLSTKWDQFYSQLDTYNALVATRDQYTPDSDDWIYYNQQVVKTHAELMGVKEEIQGIEIAQEQKRDEFKELATQRWDDVQAAYANRDTYFQNQIDLNDKYIEKLETLGINVPDEAYEAQIESLEAASASKLEQYLQARQEMIDYEGIYGADSQEYIDKYNETIQLHHEYLDYENQILEKQQQIFDNQIDRFNQVIDRINNATKRMQNISGLVDNEDVATEDGEWTSEGLTQLGMAYQQMEYYKQSADEIAEKMEEVERAYRRGEISEQKYYETMQALEDQQWDAINSYEDMKDSIVDINEARIDMIEQGLDKEIKAYQELIDLKKEELDAERDLYDFRKDIQKQTKDIASLERRIASMSGSTDASTIAERTKLEQQLREAKEGLDDTYYSHGMDSMSNALDDELDTYTKNAEDYIESLRESIKDTDLLVEQTYQKVVEGSNTVLETIYTLSEQYKFPIDSNLTDPWENATRASLDFSTYAQGHIYDIYYYVENMKGSLAKSLGDPYTERSVDADGNPLYEYSKYAKKQVDKVIEYNTQKQKDIKSSLDGGFDQAKSSIQGWGEAAGTAVDNVIKKFTDPQNGLLAKLRETTEAANKAKNAIDNMPNSDGGYTAPASSGTGNTGSTGGTVKKGAAVTDLQKILNQFFGGDLDVDGSYGPATKAAVKNMQKTLAATMSGIPTNGLYDKKTKDGMQKWLNARPVSSWFKTYKVSIPAAMYAKGTMGTTHDQLAITDESWIGEEITLAAGKNGQLQYLKKGSAVMPADISANLVEWGKLNPEMMKIGGGANLNMISNAVNKPELNFSFDSLVHVDNCSQDTLKDLEKMVDTKINQFSKQMNYAIKRFK